MAPRPPAPSTRPPGAVPPGRTPGARAPWPRPPAPPGRLRARGYSLIEIVIALTLIGILAAVAVPTFLKDRPAADVRHAADRLGNTLRAARFRAVSLRRDVYVEFEPGGERDFYTAYADLDDDPATVPSGTDAEVAAIRVSFPDESGGQRGLRLPESIEFGMGNASDSPDPDADLPGDAIDLPENPLVFEPRGTVRWPDGTLDPSGGLYLRHAENPDLVYAVVVHPTGQIKVWQLTDNGDWR